jgi:transposase
VECPRCGIHIEKVPWARRDSRFTIDFEDMAAYLAQITNKTEAAAILGIAWATVGNIVERVVAEKLDPERLAHLKRIGIDEFSYRRRHRYITVVVDHDKQRVVWAGEGNSANTLDTFFAELGEDAAAKLETITIDMAGGYIKSVEKNAPNAQIVFDRFHVQKLASDAVDQVRREMVRRYREGDDSKAAKAIKRSRFVLLKNRWDLNPKEWDRLAAIQEHNAPLYRAYLLKESLAAVFEETNASAAKRELARWLKWASRSKLKPFVRVARTIRQHKERILAYIETRLTNGITEGFNGKLRMIARRAFGFHSASALIGMLFLCCSGLTINPPLPEPWCPW